MAYFDFHKFLVEQRKLWLEEKTSVEYFYVFDLGQTSSHGNISYVLKNQIIGVHIIGDQSIKKYRKKWEIKYQYRTVIYATYNTQQKEIFEWCENNLKEPWTLLPHVLDNEYNETPDFQQHCTFTSQDQNDIMALKLKWS